MQEIQKGCVMHFSEIPGRHQNEATALAWLEVKRKSGESYLKPFYDEIPTSCRTSKFMCLAALYRCDVLKDATPDQYADYREIARVAIVHDWLAIKDLDPSFRDPEMIEHLLCCWHLRVDAMVRSCPWLLDLIPEDTVKVYASNNPLFALEAESRLREPLTTYLSLNFFSSNGSALKAFRDRKRLDLLACKIRDGDWFRGKEYFVWVRPSSLKQAIDALNSWSTPSLEYETQHLCYIMSYPIEEVVPAMKGSYLKKLLLEMYPAAALAPFLEIDRDLRGAMLEGALGL
jgi:hypothetical protein